MTTLVPKASRACSGACWHLCAPVPMHLGRQEGRKSTHDTLSVWAAITSQPRNGIPHILLHLKQIQEEKEREGKARGAPQSPAKTTALLPTGRTHTCSHPSPRTPALDQVQCSGAAVGREIFPHPGSNTSPPFWSLFLSFSLYFCPIRLTCWHAPEFTPRSF